MTQERFSPFTLPFYWKSPFRNDGSSLPYSVSIGAGPVVQGAVLTAVTTGLIGGETVTYQWTRNGTNIAGATGSSLTINIGTNVAYGEAVRCVVTVNGTPFTSNARIVSYQAPAAFTAGQWTITAA
jgi:hypothetical protein